MGSKTDLVNLALAHMGEESFDSIALDPPPPKLAKILGQYEDAVDWVLRRHPWLCTLEYLSLTLSNQAGNWKFPYIYELPKGSIRVWEVKAACKYSVGTLLDEDGAVRHVLFATASTTVNVAVGVRRPPEAFNPDVYTAASYELAARAAGPITNDPEIVNRCAKRAREAIPLGQGAEATEQGGEDPLIHFGLTQVRESAF